MKIRSSDISYILLDLKSKGYSFKRIFETGEGLKKRTQYVLENPEESLRVTVYRTVNSWIEITYSRITESK